MKHLLRLTVLVAAVFVLMGCVQTDVTINLNPDGSGTVVETVTMAKAVTQQMKATMESMQQQQAEKEGGDTEAAPVELWKESDIRAEADTMGEGVKFVSMELIDNGDFEGYKATYSFTDINKLLINQNPGSSVPKQEMQEGEEGQEGQTGQEEAQEPKTKAELITFSMQKGSPSTLIIRQPDESKKKPVAEAREEEPTEEAPAVANSPEMDEGQKEMMKSMMKMMLEGMKISISVNVPGKIVSTNATYHDDSHITLMEMDFDKLLASDTDWEKFSEAKPNSVEETKELMKSVPGMKVEQEKEIKVTFE